MNALRQQTIPRPDKRTAVLALLAVAALCLLAASIGASEALAQNGGASGPLGETGIEVRDAILAFGFIAGGIGLAVGIVMKGLGGPSKGIQYLGNVSIGGGLFCVIGTAMAIPFLQWAQTLAPGGGGGGGGGG